MLEVAQSSVEFGEVTEGETPERLVTIENGGHGNLEWEWSSQGDFFEVKRINTGLHLRLRGTPGHHSGSIRVDAGSAGQATIHVHARVIPKHRQPTSGQAGVDIAGLWASDNGGFTRFIGRPPTYQVQDLNAAGIVVGQGTATIQGNTVSVQISSMIMGLVTGQFTLSGEVMTATVPNLLGFPTQVSMRRIQQ